MAQAEAGHFLADFSADPCLNQVMSDGNAARQSPFYGARAFAEWDSEGLTSTRISWFAPKRSPFGDIGFATSPAMSSGLPVSERHPTSSCADFSEQKNGVAIMTATPYLVYPSTQPLN